MKRVPGFTIVELLIVIVVIAILASIGVIAYNGIQEKAVDDSILSDLNHMDTAQTAYGLRHSTSGKAYYSGTNGSTDTDLEFTPSAGNVIDVVINSTDYCIRGYNLKANNNSISNAFTKESSPGVCATLAASSAAIADSGGGAAGTCPTGFIKVPGNSKFSTSDFCVMKYEAKQASSTVPISQASGTPWTIINQTNATAYSANVSGCSSCHLITDNEWLTIAHNVLNVANNWTGGSVGSGSLYRGNSDSSAPMDSTNSLSSVNTRTLTLSNGEVIWDLAGNVWEWTQGTTTSQPGISGETASAWKEWNAINTTGSLASSVPSYATSAASNWTGASNGIGRLYSNSNITGQRALLRSGGWYNSTNTGVFCLHLGSTSGNADVDIGFRVAAPLQ